MRRAVQARINLNALKHNVNVVKSYAPNSKILAVIKADAYGHGMIEMAKALDGVDGFGVACVKEANALRHENITIPILLLSGFFDKEELHASAKYDLDVVVHQLQQVEQLESASLATPVNVWLKIDTGMHRLGVSPENFAEIYHRLVACSSVANINVMTHFACADEEERSKTESQIQSFNQVVEGIDGEQSLANSAAVIAYPDAHRNWVRPGIMLYGVSPFEDKTGVTFDLKPVMTYTSHIMAIRQCKKGDALGYGATWACPEDMSVGIVAVGYGDGYPRHAQAGTPVLVQGQRAPLVGRVSMDSMFVDLRSCPQAQLGDEVVLWGDNLPVEEVASFCDTISYELLCKVTARTQYIYTEN